LVSEFTVPF